MEMNHIRRGTGKPLLLIHGLGGSWRTWMNIFDALAAEREVIAIDLPGHGETPPLCGEMSMDTLADAVTSWLAEHDLTGIDVVGNSMGARLALELARRGVVGATVALDPGGFWERWERGFFYATVAASIRLVRLLQPVMPRLTGSPVGRALILAQLSARPSRIPAELALTELRSFAASPSFNELTRNLAFGPSQEGAASTPRPVVIGWGTRDRLTLPRQAERALERFPAARLHWFEGSGHYTHWDAPAEAIRLILASTGE
jgi:pimeloyl-ACP methyl ester carboxylesterase